MKIIFLGGWLEYGKPVFWIAESCPKRNNITFANVMIV
jgi:hypothetical protein